MEQSWSGGQARSGGERETDGTRLCGKGRGGGSPSIARIAYVDQKFAYGGPVAVFKEDWGCCNSSR